MKLRYILIVCLILMIKTSSGQTTIYHPFPDSNAYWSSGEFDCTICDGSDVTLYKFYEWIQGDTIINSYTYHKLYKYERISFNWMGNDTSNVFLGYDGAIRQDTSAKKLYYIKAFDTSEVLQYNLNLSIGDTLTDRIGGGNRVLSIDSIFIRGNYRKRFLLTPDYINNPLDTNYAIIEGIGSTQGPFIMSMTPNFESGRWLSCFSQNNLSYYPDAVSICQIFTGINEIVFNNPPIKIFPNPSSTTITISAKGINTYILSNTLGQVIKEGKLNGDETTIAVSALPNGIYILALDGRSFYKVSVMH